MFPKLFGMNTLNPMESNGLGVLSDCVSCVIHEVLNGDYTLELTYPLGGLHSEELEQGRLIYAQRNKSKWQLFRIREITVDYMTRTMTVYAPHISYDLENYPLPVVDKKDTAYEWLTYLQSFDYYDVTMPFTFGGNITAADTTSADRMERQPRTVRGLLLTDNDAIIDTYWPTIEFEFDNYNVLFKKSRGSATGLEVRYGKNLTNLESKDTGETLYRGCVPYFRYDIGDTPNYIFDSACKGTDFNDTNPLRRALTMVDFTEEVTDELDLELEGQPTAAQAIAIIRELGILGTRWAVINAAKNAVSKSASIDFAYIDLKDSYYHWTDIAPEEVTADIGDTVTLCYANIKQESKIVEVEYNSLTERFDSITVGTVYPNLSKTIKQIAKG